MPGGDYRDALRTLDEANVPYVVGGGYAMAYYTGIQRNTKDLDIFCKAGDYPRILSHFKALGYAIEVEDLRVEGVEARLYDGADQAGPRAEVVGDDARDDPGGAGEVHVPRFWGAIMPVVRHLPERVFQRLSFLSGRDKLDDDVALHTLLSY